MKQFSLFWMKCEWSHSVTNDLFFFSFIVLFYVFSFYLYYFYYCVNCVCFHLKCNWNSHNREVQKQKQWTLSTFSVMSSPRGFIFCVLWFLLYRFFVFFFFFLCFFVVFISKFWETTFFPLNIITNYSYFPVPTF